MRTAIGTLRTGLAVCVLALTGILWASAPSPAQENEAGDSCPPEEQHCVELPYLWDGECDGSYCYSDREFCCVE